MAGQSLGVNPVYAFLQPLSGGGGVANPFILPPLTDAAKTTLTGTQEDDKFAQQLIGKDIPIFVGGQALIGCRIIEGAFIYTVGVDNLVDMIVSPASVATPTATRTITSLNLNGTQSWTLAGGFIGTSFAGCEVNFLYGSEDQTPFASSIVRYASRAVPYRSHICIEIKNIPLSVFNNEIPFVSGFVHEADNISRNDALAALARYSRYDDSEFEFTVSGIDDFWIVAQQSTFIEYMQQLRKVFRNWNITLSDKLRVFENDSSSGVDAVLTRSNLVADSIKFTRIDPLAIPRQRSLSFIDTGRDNEINSVTARRERFPVPLTASQGTETIEVPIGMTSATAVALVNTSMLIDDIARTRMSCTVNNTLFGIEPGDIVSFDDDDSISFLGRVISAARKAADFTVDIVCEKIDYFTFNIRPVITSDGGAATASVSINENIAAVTTVTATDANDDVITYSISGGADAALFEIDAVTGELSFIAAPDFENPLDADTDNDYVVIVSASDGSLSDTQTITVTIVDVPLDGGGEPIGLLLSLTKDS